MTPAPVATSDADQLRARLGPGARRDAPGAPAEALTQARRGMAFFARQLNAVPDDSLALSTRIPGWDRAHLVAHISLEARAQALALAALRGHVSDEEWSSDLEFAATLPPRALRHLFEHAHVHVNVEWRDLSTTHWTQAVALADGATVPAGNLPMLQAGRLWWGAVALGIGATHDEIPAAVPCPDGRFRNMATA